MLVVMMGIRKLLDFVFTRNELKILDDILPEHKRTERLDDIEEAEEEQKAVKFQDESGRRASLKYTDSGLELPLANGNVMKIPINESTAPDINISEEVNKCGVWKNLEATNGKSNEDNSKKSSSAGG